MNKSYENIMTSFQYTVYFENVHVFFKIQFITHAHKVSDISYPNNCIQNANNNTVYVERKPFSLLPLSVAILGV